MADNQTRIVISALDQTKAGLDSVRNNLSGIQSAAAAVGLSLSVMGAVYAFTNLVKSTIDAADRVNDLSQSMGINVRELAKYQLATEQSGISVEGLGKGVKGLAENLTAHGDALRAAGITSKNADGALRQIADIFAGMPDGIVKTELATKLFGKSGMEMIPMLNMGSAGLAEAAAKSAEYAAALAKAAPQADAFNDKMAEFGMGAKTSALNITNYLLPAMNDVVEQAVRAQKEYGTLFALLAGAGMVGMKAVGIEIDPQKIAQEKINALFKERLEVMQKLAKAEQDAYIVQVQPGVIENYKKQLAVLKEELVAQTALANAAGIAAGRFVPKDTSSAAKDGAGLLKALQDQKDAYIAVKKHADDYLIALQKESDQTGMTTLQKKMYGAQVAANLLHTEKERLAYMTKAAALGIVLQAQEVEMEATKAATKHAEDMIAAQQAITISLNTEAVALKEKADAAELENEKIGKTAAQLAGLAAVRYDEQIAILYASEALQNDAITRDANIALIEQQIESLRRLAGAAAARPALEASAEAIKKQADAWKKFTGDIESSLTDALMRGFENGNSFGENFIKTLEHTLKTAALKIVVQAIVDPVMGGINSLSTGGSLLSGAGSMGDLAGSVGSLFATGGGMASMAGSTALMSTAAPTLSAATLGSMVMTAMPYLAAAYAVYSLITADHGTPSTHTGDTSANFGAGGTLTGSTTWGGSNATTDKVVAGLESSYLLAAKQLSITAAATQFAYGGNTGAEGKNPQFALGGGVAGKPGFYQGETAATPDAINTAAARAVFAALQGSELPGYLKGVFNGLDASKMSGQDISNTLAFAGTLKQVRDGLTETRTQAEVFAATLATAEAALGTTTATFKNDFIAAIDAGISPEKLAQWQALGTNIGAAAQIAADSMKLASDSMLAFTNDVMGMVNKIHGSVTDSIFNMQYGMQDNAGKYGMLDTKGAGLDAQMRGTTDINKIADFAQQEIDLLNTSWGLLDAAQQKATFGQFQDKLGGIDSYVTSSGATAIEIRKAQNTELSTAVADAVKKALEELAQKMADAATAVAAAKREPANVQIDITNNSNSEVFVR